MNTKPLRLLVVEDEAAHVEAIRRAFAAAADKAEIRAVSTLREYRELIAVQPPDLALVDLNLPDGRAVEVLTQPPETAPFPILVMTAFGNEQTVVETMKAGALDYVVKSPEAFAAMPQTVGRALREWRLIQQRQQASRFLFESEEKHRRLIEDIPDLVWRLNADRQAMFLSANALNVLGHPPGEIYAATQRLWFDRIHPEDAERVRTAFAALFEAGTKYDAEYRLRQPDGTWHWLRDRATTVIQKQDIRYADGISSDITERKMAEQELHNLRNAVEQSANTIVITDPMGNIEYANPAFEKSTGYTMAEALGQNPRILKSGGQDAEFYRNLWETIASEKIWRGEFHNRRKDGTLYWESATISPVLGDKGELLHFLAIKEDITERKLLEGRLGAALIAAEAANQTKSEFLGVMSHELRTPLNGVLGPAELLTFTQLDKEQKSLVETVSKCGEHLLAIVKDILDFSSMEAGKLMIEVAPMAVAEAVDLSAMAVQKSAADKGLAFHWQISRDVPLQITGDSLRIRQILINLLGNAIKFTSSGAVVLRVAPDAEGRFLVFSVADTGIGISSATIGLLFKPFTQADSTNTRAFGGTGLGLAISKRLAEAMGGSLTVASIPDKGSKFTFRLPLEAAPGCAGEMAAVPSPVAAWKATNPARTEPRPSVQTGGPPTEGKLVLVVEDDQENSTLAGKMLQSLGYRAEFAADGAAAVQAFMPGKFSAILMDVVMPRLNGLEATKKIRQVESGSRVPIIALTANVMPGDRELCLAAGMDDFLVKPFKRVELATVLASVIQIS